MLAVERVLFEDRAHQLLGGIEDRVAVVAVDRDGAAQGPELHAPDSAVFLSRSTSAASSSRASPGASEPSRSGPNATRSSSSTGWPTASHMRRTCRLRPSAIVSSSRPGSGWRTPAGLVRPSSSSTPSRSRRSACSGTGAGCDARAVDALDAVARVGQAVGELAVVRQQDQAGRRRIEPADRVKPPLAVDELGDDRPAVGVLGGRDHARRLVHEPDLARLRRDGPAVDLHPARVVHVARGVGHDRAAHAHAAVGDQLLGRAPGSDARVREVSREAHALRA